MHRPARTIAALVLATAALPAAVLTAAPATAAETCQGKPVTISEDADSATVVGTDSDDVISATGADAAIDGGRGDDTICLRDGDAIGGAGHDAVQVVDVPATQHLVVGAEDLDVTLGEGGDTLTLAGVRRGEGQVTMARGTRLVLEGRHRVALDLEGDLLEMDGGSYVVAGTPDVTAGARKVFLEGDVADNNLSVVHNSCRITVMGGRGDDRLDLVGIDLPSLDCHPTRPMLYGQRGDDVLRGRARADVLLGGPGRDRAFGRAGADTCRAEVEQGCER